MSPKPGKYVLDNKHLVVEAPFAWLDTSVKPWRLYTWLPDPRRSAQYLQYYPEEGVGTRHVIVHNFYAYRRRWDTTA